MTFVSQVLRSGDLFVDCGANIGVYTIIAQALSANTISIEPSPIAYSFLVKNLSLNNFLENAICINKALGDSSSTNLSFESTSDLATGHIASASGSCQSVDCETLDSILGDLHPTIIKVDVEGYESFVLDGASVCLSSKQPLALLLELRNHSARYNRSDSSLHLTLIHKGFSLIRYCPDNGIFSANNEGPIYGDCIYVNDIEFFRDRLLSFTR